MSNSMIFLYSTINYYLKMILYLDLDCTFKFFSVLFFLPYVLVLRQNCYNEKGFINELVNNCLFTIYFVSGFLKCHSTISSACASKTWKFLYPARMGCPGEHLWSWGSVATTVSQNRSFPTAKSGLQNKFRWCPEQNYFPLERTDKIWGKWKLSGELSMGLSLKLELVKFIFWIHKSQRIS